MSNRSRGHGSTDLRTPNPRTYQFNVNRDGTVIEGYGVVVAFVPAETGGAALMLLANDPCHDPGRSIESMLAAAIQHVISVAGFAHDSLLCVAVDALGHFKKVVPHWGGSPLPLVERIELERFKSGSDADAFVAETGAVGEVALEMLSSMVVSPSMQEVMPSTRSFLETVELHENLPMPSSIYQQVESAVASGDARRVAKLLQSDPVIASALINHANAARFAATGKTSSLQKAVTRLGMSFIQRVVFVASMMTRYHQGSCRKFDYRGYWMNAIATGSAMCALMPQHGIPSKQVDDAFTVGLVSSIGWLVVAETYPALMEKYSKHCNEDPLGKIRAQRELFPCPVRMVSERYLERLAFPKIVMQTVAGKNEPENRHWSECLAHAVRVAETLSPFKFLAVLPLAEIPAACQQEWLSWQEFLANY